jgi:hypothetical protein
MISCDIALLLLLVDQVAPDDLVVRDLDGVVARTDDDGLLSGADDLALELLRSACEGDGAADRVAEVLGRADGALDPRRGDVDRVLAQVLAQHVGDARAERVIDSSAWSTKTVNRSGFDSSTASTSTPGRAVSTSRPICFVSVRSFSCVVLNRDSLNKNGRSAPISYSW